jgi:serine/threonine protein phosphatase PrpC
MSASIHGDKAYNAFLKEQGCWSYTKEGSRWTEGRRWKEESRLDVKGLSEDRFSVFINDDISFYLVFDGHGGILASQFCEDNLISQIYPLIKRCLEKCKVEKKPNITILEEIRKILNQAILDFDKELYEFLKGERVKKKNEEIEEEIRLKVLQERIWEIFNNMVPEERDRARGLLEAGCDDETYAFRKDFKKKHFSELTDDEFTELRRNISPTPSRSNSYISDEFDEFNNVGTTVSGIIFFKDLKGGLSINIGDSQTTLLTKKVDGTSIDVPLSHPHRPDDTSEIERIVKAGGRVYARKIFDKMNKWICVSRAFGDFSFKNLNGSEVYHLKPDTILTAEPGIEIFEINKNDTNIFTVCTDGISDHSTMSQIHTIVSNAIDKGEDPAEKLCESSFFKRDDLTAIVIKLGPE